MSTFLDLGPTRTTREKEQAPPQGPAASVYPGIGVVGDKVFDEKHRAPTIQNPPTHTAGLLSGAWNPPAGGVFSFASNPRAEPPPGAYERPTKKEFFIDNRLVPIHFIFAIMWGTGLAPWEFEFSFPGSLISTFLWKACKFTSLISRRTLLGPYGRYIRTGVPCLQENALP